ncbi:MAG: hypothetical protein KBG82_01315, partial [Spirochaetes bacterium]|nr:hypothetical protein [Spirochaetota bacterium]
MKRTLIILALLILFASTTVFAQSAYNFFGLGLVGFSTINAAALEENQGAFFDNALWGINGRIKLSKTFGFAFDLLYLGTMYYYDYNETWYGPLPWYKIVGYITGVQEDWAYYHDEFLLTLNIGLYLPLSFLQLYFEMGPLIFFTTPSDEYDYDPSFADYYDSIYGGGFNMGLDFKLGLDIFITRSISLGMYFCFIEPTIADFVIGITSD